jgi:hypothetical protein
VPTEIDENIATEFGDFVKAQGTRSCRRRLTESSREAGYSRLT